ncbi:septum formation inhibitor Maf [Maribacter polysaccharolyticus]|uniref:septum formation inhibitor Maf n=1 Tax=Maribacter polysaccharolyticus TaxID=3020831 RepID=UPI00237F0C23|nr:septum formation inhibitor Maf [Maribacter polysaccharolyticus]MDE3740325.1 septum formation inhibitor Maf [Maribacter polysaccharolyticus]
MKIWLRQVMAVIVFAMIIGTFGSCKDKKADSEVLAATIEVEKRTPEKPLSNEFKSYWYAGNAELTSYALEEVRYGEVREGKAVLIYVTEPFVADKQVKSDTYDPNNIPVLKLNTTKKYLTGIYPYSIMSSSFYPVHDDQHALKVTFSAQEWCGHVFTQLNNRKKFEVSSYSYFEREGDQNIMLDKEVLENGIWNKIRIAPSDLPLGDFKMIPSLEYLRMSHSDLKAYTVKATLTTNDEIATYTIAYPDLGRTLEIEFTATFPHSIESWTDTQTSGQGPSSKKVVSRASKIKTLKTPYWQQNGNIHLSLRDTLGL